MHRGKLKLKILNYYSSEPIINAKIKIKQSETENVLKKYPARLKQYSSLTNNMGYSRIFELDTPIQEHIERRGNNKSFSVWDILIEAEGYISSMIKGVEIFPGVSALQTCRLIPAEHQEEKVSVVNVLPNSVFEKYPPKIPEAIKRTAQEGLIKGNMISREDIPDVIIVHNGLPDDNTAINYSVDFHEYIKNVASSSMDPTWNERTLKAGVLCIISFTLNRFFKGHYRKKGKNYDITSSTAYDQLFSYGRNIYTNISRIVDELCYMYISEEESISPLLVQCCDGKYNSYPGWFPFWKSKLLGDEGKSTEEILKLVLGENIQIRDFNKANNKIKSNNKYRYRSFTPPMYRNSSKEWIPTVLYPDDV